MRWFTHSSLLCIISTSTRVKPCRQAAKNKPVSSYIPHALDVFCSSIFFQRPIHEFSPPTSCTMSISDVMKHKTHTSLLCANVSTYERERYNASPGTFRPVGSSDIGAGVLASASSSTSRRTTRFNESLLSIVYNKLNFSVSSSFSM